MTSPVGVVLEKTPKKAWNECLRKLKESLTPMTFNTWFMPIKALAIGDGKLQLQMPTSYHYEWIEERYSKLLNETVKSVLGNDISIDYLIQEAPQEDLFSSAGQSIELKIRRPEKDLEPVPELPKHETNLKPVFTFENFIKGGCNELATAAAMAIASAPPGTTSFNPLFIYGGSGLGKTHLAIAIGNRISALYPTKRVLYIPSDKFFTQFVESIKSNQGAEFQSFYQTMDVLIIDDIQFFEGREKTQDMFFHLFNALHQNGKQIVLTSDRAPKDLRGVDDRLISRFSWGLTTDVQPPDFETRLAILTKKAEEFKLVLPEDFLEYIAMNVTSNVRELEGCLIRLLANTITSREIDLALVKESVWQISTMKKTSISIDLITRTVAEYLRVDEHKLRDKTRKQEIVIARQLSMFFTKEFTKLSLKNIGLYFGGRDHSTVIHACDVITGLAESDAVFSETVKMLRNKIQLSV